MKSLIFISYFIILTPYVFSQTKETKYYDNGKLRLEGFVKNNTYDSTFISYYENGNKKAEGIFKKCNYKTNSVSIVQMNCGTDRRDTTEPNLGIKNGQWKYYYQSGQIKNIENYFCNINVGQWLFYDSTGKLLENEFYNAGNLIQRQEYSTNGNLEKFTTRTYQSFKENKKDKSYKTTYKDNIIEYYETGELKCIKTVNEDGEPTGKYIEYWQNGFVKNEGEYKDGLKNGIFREYYENGNTKFEGIIKNDIPQDKQYFSNDKGKNIKVETWKKSKLVKTEEKSGS